MVCKCTNKSDSGYTKNFLIYILKIKYDTVSNISSENSSRLFL